MVVPLRRRFHPILVSSSCRLTWEHSLSEFKSERPQILETKINIFFYLVHSQNVSNCLMRDMDVGHQYSQLEMVVDGTGDSLIIDTWDVSQLKKLEGLKQFFAFSMEATKPLYSHGECSRHRR